MEQAARHLQLREIALCAANLAALCANRIVFGY
jgi:hypothetical protein